jgi:transcriptional regulator with XRE-family HTH domain
MSDTESAREQLAARLKELREGSDLGRLTQRQVADALGASTPLISSWEGAKEVPPESRLQAYGRLFATPRSGNGDRVALVPADDLTAEERGHMETLVEDLVRLRTEALEGDAPARRHSGALGGRFWFFPDRQVITILCTPLSYRQLGYRPDGQLAEGAPPISAYSRASHPNHISLLHNGDADALVELVGHIRAENPTAEIRWRTYDEIHTSDELTGHLIILGGGEEFAASAVPASENPVNWFIRRLELPVLGRMPDGGDEEFDTEFVITTNNDGEPTYQGPREEVYRPIFLRADVEPGRPRITVDGIPQLEYDVALIARRTNPLNLSARITICTGVFSRGTYGAVRAFTDANLRTRNERYIQARFSDVNDFWIMFQVPVYGGQQTVTPDFERAFLRLRDSHPND